MESTRREKTVLMVGEMMLVLQKVEQLLIATLLNLVTMDEADKRLEKVLLGDKETLGRLLKNLSSRLELPQDFASTFDDFLARRNLFVHKLMMEPWFDLQSDQGCDALDAFMRDTRSSAKVVLYVLISSAVGPAPANLSDEGASRQAAILSKLVETAEADFGGLTEDQYINSVVRNALTNYSVERRRP